MLHVSAHSLRHVSAHSLPNWMVAYSPSLLFFAALATVNSVWGSPPFLPCEQVGAGFSYTRACDRSSDGPKHTENRWGSDDHKTTVNRRQQQRARGALSETIEGVAETGRGAGQRCQWDQRRTEQQGRAESMQSRLFVLPVVTTRVRR